MRPEDIDDLFKKKLGGYNPAPSPDAWQRLQDRLQPEPKKKVIPMWWSVAATLAFLILTGTYFYYNQFQTPETGRMAQVTETRPAQQATDHPVIGAERAPKSELQEPTNRPEEASRLAQASRPERSEDLVAPTPKQRTSPQTMAQATSIGRAAVAARAKKQVLAETAREESLASALPETRQLALREPATLPGRRTQPDNLEVMEVVILKTEPTAELALVSTAEYGKDETEPSVKGRVVKGLLNQVKNLATGNKVDLPQLNPNNYSIAFETQIGNRKISKTINF